MTGYDNPATGCQLHTIACLCQSKGIYEPVEEQEMTIGEAGQLIRRLKNEQGRQATICRGNLARKKKDLR